MRCIGRMSPSQSFWLISALILVAGPLSSAGAVAPPLVQDDAGSGRDAPDTISQDITIAPDVAYTGSSLGWPLDQYDVYHFEAQAGQVFQGMAAGSFGWYRILNDTGEEFESSAYSYSMVPLNTGPIVVDLPYSGDHYFQVVNAVPAEYRFGYSLTGPAPPVQLLDGSIIQNDAGSGRDAPGEISRAIRIVPDVVYNGSSPGPIVDTVDIYHFVAEAGQVFRGLADGLLGCYRLIYADGNESDESACAYAHTSANSGLLVVELPYDGDYFFEVRPLAPAMYRFAYSLAGNPPEVRMLHELLGLHGPSSTVNPLRMPDGCHGDYENVSSALGPIPRFTDDCYHMRTAVNPVDTAKIDVLLVPPASTYPERDLRVMRQAVEMWSDGIHTLAGDMGLHWLDEGVDIDIVIDNGSASSDALWDPEIIVVATNPVGGVGIGTDVWDVVFGGAGPCHGQPNPLAGFEDWQALPGFDTHHNGEGGTYTTTCNGGGSLCFAVNGAIDPAPGYIDFYGLYGLVAHEVGHCLSIGHVGDALDHEANAVPSADIMAYADQDHEKCVSTLDVEAFAVMMSHVLLDVPLGANDGANPEGAFQVQHPDDHRYASASGLAADCQQPDAGLVPRGGPEPVHVQDDAGSGQDAPDHVSQEIRIHPDVLYHGGSPGWPLDSYDVYHLVGGAGQTLRGWADGHFGCYRLLDAEGDPVAPRECSYANAPINTGPIMVDLPYTGDFYFEIGHTAPASYRFGFSLNGSAPPVLLQDALIDQNDAGSGQDAPQDLAREITIQPDVVYDGLLLGVFVDNIDVYHFVGGEGQVFTGMPDGSVGWYRLLDAQGDQLAAYYTAPAPFTAGPIVVELPYSGDYYFQIVSTTPAEYQFDFTLAGSSPVG